MEIKYNKDLIDFEIKINGKVFIIPSRKIIDFKNFLCQIESQFIEEIVLKTSGSIVGDYSKTKITKEQASFLQNIIDDCVEKELPIDFLLMQKGFISAPQKPFSLMGCQIITKKLQEKFAELSTITINQINVVSHREDYECPRDFIVENNDFTKTFVLGLSNALSIATKNPDKINFFLMREQRHTFLLVIIEKDLFMFDSVGQRYGKQKVSLGIGVSTDTLKLDEIAYTNMYLQFLKDNPEWNLYFNLNNLQQDTTNCFTFATDFLDGFCETISKNTALNNLQEFSKYLKSFFPVVLFENKQIHHEGAIDVIDDLLKDGYKDQFICERPILPQSIIRTSQLNYAFTQKAERICIGSTRLINLEAKLIRKKDGTATEVFVNRRIEQIRRNQEKVILGAIK